MRLFGFVVEENFVKIVRIGSCLQVVVNREFRVELYKDCTISFFQKVV